jgi:GPH family glycoside/pentoside/hexuronide:cation symporter
MTEKHPAHQAAVSDRVPLKIRIAWGFGGLADNYIMNTLNALGLLLYVDFFKVSPVLAGTALFIPRFIDALIDPIVGNISDNTRSRWGRRRPYMVFGAVFSAVLLPLLWMPPFAETAGNVWYANGPFLWLVVMGMIYTLAYTFFVVPYTALGYELTSDYDEKTRVLAWRMYIGLAGSMTVPWLYRWCTMGFFPNEIIGARWVSVVVGAIIIITGLLPVFFCREREDVKHQETIKILDAMKCTLTNKPFLILLVAYLIIIIGLFSAGNLFFFINIYYVCQGDKAFAGELGGLCGTIGAIVSYLSMFIVTAVSVRFSKKVAMIVGLVFALVGAAGCLWALDPRWPYAQVLTTIISMLGLQGCWLMVSSMVADICDEDELLTGLRREGMFGAVNGFALKAALALTSLIGGWLLTFSGFDPNTASAGISIETALMMKNLIIGFQVIALIIAIAVFAFYPISRKRAEETRRLLDKRKRHEK